MQDIRVTDLDLGNFDDFRNRIDGSVLSLFCNGWNDNAFNLIDGINGQFIFYLVSIIVALKVIENISPGANFPLSDEFRYFTNILLGALAGFFS